MLGDFLAANRMLIIERCRLKVAARSQLKAVEPELAHGIPVFLDQLIGALAIRQQGQLSSLNSNGGQSKTRSTMEVGATGVAHGRDLLNQGFTLEQVVRDYGDVCQAVTHLAFETGEPIEVLEFHTFNRCLDDAIAGAVTEHAKQGALTSEFVSDALNSRLGPLAHELRSHLYAATLVVAAHQSGHRGRIRDERGGA